MRVTICSSTLMLSFLMAFNVFSPAHAQTYAVGEPMILECPSSYKGDMTVVETNQTQAPWQILRWNCSGQQGLVKKFELEQYLLKNPPAKGGSRRWDEKCPSGSVGTIRFSEHNDRRFVETWTCSVDGSTKMSFDNLKKMLETKQTVDGASGVAQTRNCPSPYLGSYSVTYSTGKWDLHEWTCMVPATKQRVNEATMRMLMPSASNLELK